MPNPIIVPENAPFSTEQREWLNQFFGKMFPTGMPSSVPTVSTGPALPVTILFGSQTGNSEGLAKKLSKALAKGPFDPKVYDLGSYNHEEQLPNEENLLIITSTYGDGEPPDNAADFHEWLMSDAPPKLDKVRFSVLGLGDTEYPDFCQSAIDFDTRLGELGAERVHDRVDCDVDYDEPYAQWKDGVISALKVFAPAAQVDFETLSTEEEEVPFGKSNPFPSEVLNNYNLAKGEKGKETYHVELSLEGSELSYEVGDALGVAPLNDPKVVDDILANLPFNTNEDVPLPKGGEAPLRDALIGYYDIRTLNKAFLTKWQERSGHPFLRALIEKGDKQDFEAFTWGRELIDLILDYPADFSDAEDFVSILRKLNPRLYSIASSPNAHPGEVHLTVGAVRYQTFGRDRGGVCSTFLADRVGDSKPGVFIHSNKAFRLPENGDLPIIMVGPGTGIAPFRAFLEERVVSEAKGSNWLFFGNPHQESDFYYEEYLTDLEKQGKCRLSLAFSRDQAHKIYVQHRMIEEGADLWSQLEAGAHFYVCGDASRMAKDVDAALHQIAQDHGKLSEQEAIDYIKALKKAKRYARDVY